MYIQFILLFFFLDRRRPSIHIIQLPHGELEREDRLIEPTQCESTSSRWHSQRLHLTAADERSIVRTYPTDAIINPAYTHDEEYVINGEGKCQKKKSEAHFK